LAFDVENANSHPQLPKLRVLSTSVVCSRQAVAETCPLVKMRSQLLRAVARSKQTTNVARSRTFSSSARRPADVELTIDGKKVSIEAGSALIQACEKAGVTIPRYCYHEYVLIFRPQDRMLSGATENSSLPETVECALSKSNESPNP
jgi:hypothetical protein